MSNSTNRVQEELLNGLTPADANQHKENSNSELVHREKVQGSPFTIVGNEEHGYFIAFGHYRLSEPQKTIIEAYGYLKENQWNISMNFMLTLMELWHNEKQQTNS